MPSLNKWFKNPSDNPDHARRRDTPAPSDPEIARRLQELVRPVALAHLAQYRAHGLRERTLTLPVMVALVLSLIWRQIPGVRVLQRMLAREGLLWVEPLTVSQPALSERLRVFPADLFRSVLVGVLAQLPERVAARTRPVPPVLATLRTRFSACYALDGTTLEALFRKLQALRERPAAPLAGRLAAVVDLVSHLPVQVWYTAVSQTNDRAFLPEVLEWLPTHSLVVFDLGYFGFPFFDELSETGRWFVTRCREQTSFTVERVLVQQPHLQDRIVHLGKYASNPSQHSVRLIEVQVGETGHRYLTNILDPERLSVVEAVAVYAQRWQIESAFLLVKRLLGLAYLWVGSLNGVQLQVWATWLYYAVLIDLCEDVAELLQLPLQSISVEMVSRSLYFYAQAVAQGYTGTAAAYYADPANRDLGIVKQKRSKRLSLTDQVRRLVDGPPPTPRDRLTQLRNL